MCAPTFSGQTLVLLLLVLVMRSQPEPPLSEMQRLATSSHRRTRSSPWVRVRLLTQPTLRAPARNKLGWFKQPPEQASPA